MERSRSTQNRLRTIVQRFLPRRADTLETLASQSDQLCLARRIRNGASDPALAVAHTSSGAEVLTRKARKANIVSAFSTVPSEVLFDVFTVKRRTRRRPSLMYCGDNQHAKGVAATLIRDVGFDPVDAGPLRIARYLEPFSLAMAQLAYGGDQGPEVAYRLERFEK